MQTRKTLHYSNLCSVYMVVLFAINAVSDIYYLLQCTYPERKSCITQKVIHKVGVTKTANSQKIVRFWFVLF